MNCIMCGKELSGRQKKWCSRRCERLAYKRTKKGFPLDVRPKRSHLEWTDEDIQNKINSKSDKMVYIGGYVDCESFMYLYCSDCGNAFKWSAKGLRRQRTIRCDNCSQIISNANVNERIKDCQERKYIRHQETLVRQAARKEEHIKNKYRICKNCEKPFYAKTKELCCSDICRKKYNNREKEIKRRLRENAGIRDKGISIRRLIKRDGCGCWLCHKPVNLNDYEVRQDGSFVAGPNYPSIDHVQALANGGQHTWDNVRLAHIYCNTMKRDKMFVQTKSGQLKLFC